MSKETIIITGASGEIGQNLIEAFSKNNHYNIVAIDLRESENKIKNCNYIIGDILDDDLISSLHDQYYITSIFHLAAMLSSKAELNPDLAFKINVQGTVNFMELALAQTYKNSYVTKFFFPSSIAVYNNNNNDNNVPLSESMYCNPLTIYGQHKLYCENLGIAFDRYGNELKDKIDFRCIRFPGIISANTLPIGGTSDYLPEMVNAAINKKNYTCFVNKGTILPFIVMPDAILAILTLMNADKKKLFQHCYNISSFSPTILDVYQKLLQKNSDFKLNYNIDNKRQKIVNSWPDFIDDHQARSDWGWSPKYSFEQAFSNYLLK
tara:strand:+ start:533 stop:1498 length:966 start_codon:yes stop_codon:yes gene_type:complete